MPLIEQAAFIRVPVPVSAMPKLTEMMRAMRPETFELLKDKEDSHKIGVMLSHILGGILGATVVTQDGSIFISVEKLSAMGECLYNPQDGELRPESKETH